MMLADQLLVEAGAKPIAVLNIQCAVPSKKNLLRPTGVNERRVRRTPLVYKTGVREQMKAIEQYIMISWLGRPAVDHPRVFVEFRVVNEAIDRDGMWTTVLDCMKKAGVIVDDSIRRFNGVVTLMPATVVSSDREAGVTVTIYAA